jgi:hypothetical protein
LRFLYNIEKKSNIGGDLDENVEVNPADKAERTFFDSIFRSGVH